MHNPEKSSVKFCIDSELQQGESDLLSKYIEDSHQFIYMKHLEWDSEFFNKESFLLDIDKSNFVPSNSLVDLLGNRFNDTFMTAKIKSSTSKEYIDFVQNCNFKYVGAEITLQHNNERVDIVDDKYRIHKVSENKNIPYVSLGSVFSDTRFHSDMNIDGKKADDLWVQYLLNYIPSNSRKMFLAYDDEVLIGVVLVNIETALNEATLFYVAVIPSYQSKGVGKSMMKYVLDYLHKHKVSVIKTETQLKNVNALNYYIKNGFTVVKETSTVWHRWSL